MRERIGTEEHIEIEHVSGRNTRRNNHLGVLWACTATVLVGGSVAASSVVATYPPLGGQAMRYALGALVLAGVARAQRLPLPRPSRREALLLLALALTGLAGFNLTLLAAVRHADPAAVAAIVGCVPLLLALAGPLLRGRSPTYRLLGGALLVSMGAVAAQWAGGTSPLGLLWSLCALAGEAAFSLLAVPLLPHLGAVALSFYACAVASVVLALGAIAVDGRRALPVPTPAQAGALAYLAFAVTAGAFLAWYTALARLGPERAGLFSGLIPVSALATSALVGTAMVTPLRVVGIMLVGAGLAWGLRRGAPAKEATTAMQRRNA